MRVGLSLALALAVTGQVLYHVTQKSVGTNVNPALALVAFYLIAAVASLPLLRLFPLELPLLGELGRFDGAIVGVGLSIVLCETGFLLAYRAGGDISTSFVVAASAVAVLLMLVGALVWREALTVGRVGGIVLCLAGIWLISRPAR